MQVQRNTTKSTGRELHVQRPAVEVLPDSALVAPAKGSHAQSIDGVDKRPRVKGTPIEQGPGQVGPIGTPKPVEVASPASAIEKEVLVALQGGYENVAAKAAELKDLLTRSRMVQEAKDRLDVQVAVLETLQGGKPALLEKADELRHTMMVAMMDERGSNKMQLEIDVLTRVAKDFAPLEKRMKAIDSLTMRALLPPDASISPSAEHRALKA